MPYTSPKTVKILDGETESKVVDAADYTPSILVVPAGFAGAAITIHVVQDGVSYPLYAADGTALEIYATAEQATILDIVDLVGVEKFKLVAATEQTEDVDLVLLTRSLS